MPCNHDACKTRFCPDCGKEINPPGPLHSLLAHLTARITVLEDQGMELQNQWAALGREPNSEETVARNAVLARIDTNRLKWTAWQDALTDVLFPPEEEATA